LIGCTVLFGCIGELLSTNVLLFNTMQVKDGKALYFPFRHQTE